MADKDITCSGIASTTTSASFSVVARAFLITIDEPYCRVTPSNLGACLSSNAYMCFYVKRHLDYKPYMKPTYRVTRDNDIVREQEQEKLKEMARMKEVEKEVDDALMATIAGD